MNTPILSPGAVVGWIESGTPQFGRFLREQRGKWLIETPEKKEQEIRPKDIAVVGPPGDPQKLGALAGERAKEWDVELLWNILSESGYEEISPEEAARIYMSEPDPLAPCIAWIALWEHPEYFARVGRTRFRVRSRKEREREEQRLKERKKEEELLRILEEGARALKSRSLTLYAWLEMHQEFRELVEEEFLTGRPSGRLPRVRERLRHLIEDRYEEEKVRWPLPYFLGSRLGFRDPWGIHPLLHQHALFLRTLGMPPPLPESAPLEPVGKLISIDDATTRDRDDAFAVQPLSREELLLDIAIADLSSTVGAEDELLDSLADLGTSVYLPTQTFHLLPEEWGLKRHSLDAGTTRPLWIVRLRVHLSGKILEPPRFYKGSAPIAAQWSYEEFDPLLEQVEEYRLLYTFTQAFKRARYERGADIIDHPEATVIVKNDQPVELKVTETATGARALIRELMILANTSFALFARDQKLLIPYRIQEGGSQERSPSLVRFSPAPHRGIGVEAYTYASSPIRRVHDLLVQRMIATFYGGKSLPEHLLMELAERSEQNYQIMRRWMKLADLYWKLRYLEQFPSTPLSGTILHRTGNRVLVRVSPLQILLTLPPPQTPMAEELPLRVLSLDSDRGILELAWG